MPNAPIIAVSTYVAIVSRICSKIAGHASSKMYLIEDASTLALAFTSFHIPYRFIRIMLNIVSNRPSSFLFDIVSP